jgi:hypothetical protein
MFEGLRLENVYIFYSRLEYFPEIWHFYDHWVHFADFSRFWYQCSKKNLATLVLTNHLGSRLQNAEEKFRGNRTSEHSKQLFEGSAQRQRRSIVLEIAFFFFVFLIDSNSTFSSTRHDRKMSHQSVSTLFTQAWLFQNLCGQNGRGPNSLAYPTWRERRRRSAREKEKVFSFPRPIFFRRSAPRIRTSPSEFPRCRPPLKKTGKKFQKIHLFSLDYLKLENEQNRGGFFKNGVEA